MVVGKHLAQCWNGGERWSTVKGTLNPPVLTRKVNIPAFMCFSVCVLVCLSVCLN